MSSTHKFIDVLKHRIHPLIIFCFKIFLVVAQCVLLRGTLLPDSKPYRHLNPRHFHPLDSEVLVSAAFSLMEYVPQEVGGGTVICFGVSELNRKCEGLQECDKQCIFCVVGRL